MNGITEFGIHIVNNQREFHPGDQIVGHVILNCTMPVEMKGIFVGCIGSAECHWSVTSGDRDNRRTRHYKGQETLFQYQGPLFGGDRKQIHPQGRKAYQFTVHLPGILPNSYKDMYGNIQYKIIAQINKSGKKYKKSKSFSIRDVIDINEARYQQQKGDDQIINVDCLPCFSGPLNFNASILRTGFCPGEKILIDATIENRTSRSMNSLKAKLYQVVKYTSSSPWNRKTEYYTIARIDGPAIPKNEFAVWKEEPLKIPRKTVPTIKTKVITVKYQLEIKVGVPCSTNPCIMISITMGTVPLRQPNITTTTPHQNTITTATASLANVPTELQTHFIAEPPPTFSSVCYPEEPPPSYESLEFEIEDDENFSENQQTDENEASN